MTNQAIRQLQYVAKTVSLRSIASETGLDPVSLKFSLNGSADVPQEYKAAVRNLYNKTAYTNLKSAGMSASQAGRFRSYAPETVNTLESNMLDMRFKYSMGLLAKLVQKLPANTTFEQMGKYWEEAQETITEGFQTSRKTYEDWQNY